MIILIFYHADCNVCFINEENTYVTSCFVCITDLSPSMPQVHCELTVTKNGTTSALCILYHPDRLLPSSGCISHLMATKVYCDSFTTGENNLFICSCIRIFLSFISFNHAILNHYADPLELIFLPLIHFLFSFIKALCSLKF